MENLNLIKNMEWGHLPGQVETHIQDNITEMKEMVKEQWNGLMEVSMKVNG
jgi:hypothetical protein